MFLLGSLKGEREARRRHLNRVLSEARIATLDLDACLFTIDEP